MPELNVKPWNPNLDNGEIIAAIRDEASSDYQRRIPNAIKADTKNTLDQLNNYRPLWNEFVGALVNKVGLTVARNNVWSSELARYMKGLVSSGDTVEEIQTGLIRGYTFDPRREAGEKMLFGKHLPEVQSSFHTINHEMVYPITIQRSTLQRAFLTPDGLAQFITQAMEAPTTSDNWDMYLETMNLFRRYEEADGFFRVHVDDIADANSTAEQARGALRTLREWGEILPFISRNYNAAKMPVHCKPEDMILVTTPQFKSGLDVNALAAAFNVSYAEVPQRVHTVPQEHINVPGAQAFLTTKDFFQIYDTYIATDSQPNPAGRYENFYFHHDAIISASRFVPAVMLTTGEGDVITISDKPVTGVNDIVITDSAGNVVSDDKLERGASYIVTGGAVTDGDASATILEWSGTETNFSFLAQTGTMHIWIGETSQEVTITSTSEANPAYSTSRTFTIAGDGIQFWPNPGEIKDSDKDGLIEVTPTAPTFETPTVTIPNVKGVQYSLDGSPVNNGSTHDISAEATVTAAARSGHEIAAGADTSWTFTP